MPRTVIIGAAGGIGRALARRLVTAHHTIIACGRRPEPLAALKAELPAAVDTHTLDARDPAAVDALFANLDPAPDGVVNLAGAFLLKPAHLTSPDELADQIAQNLTTAFNTLRAAVKRMNGGSIVLISSVAANLGLANHEAVAAAKAAVEGLTRAAAASYAPRNIRINAVAPGLTRTPLTERLTANEAALKASTAMHPLGRLGDPDDIAAAIAFLLSPAAAWTTGQTLAVDGGLSRLRPR